MERLICIAIGYACGLFQTAYILGKIYHIDIRKQGSGNLGSTNVLRTLGKKAGALNLLCKVYNRIGSSFLIGIDRCFCSHKSDICLTGYYSRHCLICSKASYKRHIKPLIFKISFFDCHILRSIENRMCYFGEPHMTEVTCFQTL